MRPQAYGIDISDRSMEIVGMRLQKGRPALLHASRVEVPPGAIERGHIVDPVQVARALTLLLDRAIGRKRGKVEAGIALPSSIVYSRNFLLPAGLDAEILKKAAVIEAQDSFPVSAAESFGDTLIGDPIPKANKRSVMHFAVARSDVNAYLDVLSRAGVTPLWFDCEDVAVARGVAAERPKVPLLVVDVGARTTTVLYAAQDGPHMSSSIAFGGDMLTEAIEKKFSMSFAEAEDRKRAWGMDPEVEEGRVILALQRPLETLVAELKKTVKYVEARFGTRVQAMVLCGGTSLLPGLPEYIKECFPDIAIVRGDPFAHVEFLADVDRNRSMLYASAIGVGLRAVSARNGPGMDLSANNGRAAHGPQALLNKISNAMTALRSMVTKKPHPRKKKADAAAAPPIEEVQAVVPVEPEPMAAPAPVPDFTPPEMMKKDAPVVPASAPPVKWKPEPMPAPAPVVEEETDFGSGIGDILAQPEKVSPRVPQLSDMNAVNDPSRRSIESILKREESAIEEDDDLGEDRPARSRGSWMTYVLLVVLFLVFAAAAVGIFMFVRKNGMPTFGRAPAPVVEQVPEVVVPPAPKVPSSVNGSMMIVSDKTKVVDGVLLARAVETDVKASDTFAATGEAEVGAGKASGKARIVNTTGDGFTFVATTRLMSKEGVLFRMSKTTVIPASGEVEVDVVADKPGAAGDIGPTTFVIPGLPTDLQAKITAVSDAAMVGGGSKAKGVSQQDIDDAKASLEEKLKTEALANIKAMLADGEVLNADLVTSKEVSMTSPKAGTPATTFTVSATYRFRVLLVPEKDVMPFLEKALRESVPTDMNAAEYALGTPAYTVLAFDTAAEKAEIRAEASVKRADAVLGE